MKLLSLIVALTMSLPLMGQSSSTVPGGSGSPNVAPVTKTASYPAVTGDFSIFFCKPFLINSAGATTFTLPNPAPAAGACATLQNIGAGVATVANNGLTIDTTAGSLTVNQSTGLIIWSDGTNYVTNRGIGGAASATAWSAILNPGGNLSLTMGGNTSTFNTTTALSQFFAWKNTTAAVLATSQGSPFAALCGRAFHASADTESCLTLSMLPGNGNDAAITASYGTTGASTGIMTHSFSGPVQAGQGCTSCPGQLNLPGNTAAPALTANTFNFFGPNVAAFTNYALQAGSVGPAAAGPMIVTAPSGNISQVNYGTNSGNTTTYGTTSGTLTSGDCVKIDASGNLVDAGAACGGGSAVFSIVGFNQNLANGTTNYSSRLDQGGGTTITPAGVTATVSQLYIVIGGALGAGNSIAVTVFKNGVAQTITCTINNPSTTCSDTAHSFTVVATDTIGIQIVCTGTCNVQPVGSALKLTGVS